MDHGVYKLGWILRGFLVWNFFTVQKFTADRHIQQTNEFVERKVNGRGPDTSIINCFFAYYSLYTLVLWGGGGDHHHYGAMQ
jgi:hypothetical protein